MNPQFAAGLANFRSTGDGTDASQLMTNPVEETLFFAGEHTDTGGDWGTVHGALSSGIRVTRQMYSTALKA
jgi:monoamine oxidase